MIARIARIGVAALLGRRRFESSFSALSRDRVIRFGWRGSGESAFGASWGRSRGDRRLRRGAVVFGDRVLLKLNRVDGLEGLEGVERVVTAGLAGSVLNRLDCQAVSPASSSPIELCGVARSKRVSFVIGLQLLVVVFGRRALVGSDPGRIGIRRRAVERRVACVVASVIGLIGPRALNWGFGRSVPIGGSCRDERISRFDVFSLDQGRDRNLLLGGGLSRGLLTGCEGGDGRGTGVDWSRLRSPVFGDCPVFGVETTDASCTSRVRGSAVFSLRCRAPGLRRLSRLCSGIGLCRPNLASAGIIRCSPRRRLGPLPRVFGDRPLRSRSRDLGVFLARAGIDRRPENSCSIVVPTTSSDCWFGAATSAFTPCVRGSTAAGEVSRFGALPRACGDRPLRMQFRGLARHPARAGIDRCGFQFRGLGLRIVRAEIGCCWCARPIRLVPCGCGD